MYKKYFSKFLQANYGKYHFACHSHHYWADVTLEAQTQYWLDSAKYTDNKWTYFFTEKIPKLDQNIKNVLNIKKQNITYAPNTHELLFRIISSFDTKKGKIKVLTTDSEFYSFQRQIVRLIEEDLVEVDFVNTKDSASFNERFINQSKTKSYDLAFFSNVFFNSGIALENLSDLCKSICAEIKVIDGYHSFMALDLDLSFMDDKTYFLAGAYKYAGSGEGACFLVSPNNCTLRPYNTGWFAELGELEKADHSKIKYSNDGLRFAGATLDFTSIYRFLSILELYKNENIKISDIHNYVSDLQTHFIESISELNISKQLLNPFKNSRGHFLAFDCISNQRCQEIVTHLLGYNILCDNRNEVLRIGFSLYQSMDDIKYLVEKFTLIDKEMKW